MRQSAFFLFLLTAFFANGTIAAIEAEAAALNSAAPQDSHKGISSCERQFTDEGFHKGYTRLYDEVMKEWLPLAEKLRREEADPEKTHIQYFADKAPEHLDFIVEKILESWRKSSIAALSARKLLHIHSVLKSWRKQSLALRLTAETDLPAAHSKNRYDDLQDSIKSNQEKLEKLFRAKSYQNLTEKNDDTLKIYIQLKWLAKAKDDKDKEFFVENAFLEFEEEAFGGVGFEWDESLEGAGDEDADDFVTDASIVYHRLNDDYSLLSDSEDKKIYSHLASLIGKLGLQDRIAAISAVLLSDDIAPELESHPILWDSVILQILLTEYTNLAIQNKALTYKWWLNFNEAFKVLSERSPDTDYFADILSEALNSNETFQDLLKRFPQEIVMPAIAGEVGIMALNRAVPQGVYIYGMGTNEDFDEIGDFMEHDEDHISAIRDANLRANPAYNLFHNIMIKAVEELPTDKRKNVEIIYNMLIYETPTSFINKSPSWIKEFLLGMLSDGPGELVIEKMKRLPSSLPEQARQLEKMVDDFVELFSQIQTGQAPSAQPYTEEDFARAYNQSSEKVRTYHAKDFIIKNKK